MESVAVVAVPFPAQGHLNGMLHLSLQLSSRGLPVHYAAPAAKASAMGMRWDGNGEGAAGSGGGEAYAGTASSWNSTRRRASSPQPCTRVRAWRTWAAGAA